MTGLSDQRRAWLTGFVEATRPTITDPFLLTLSAAIAAQESTWGRNTIRGPQGVGLNEVGLKAVAGRPAITCQTRETQADGSVGKMAVPAAFRLFRDRREQAETLRYAMDQSSHYEAARLLYVLAFYLAWTTGNVSGTKELVKHFNDIATSGLIGGVNPLRMSTEALRASLPADTVQANHKAARRAVMLFAELTGAGNEEGIS